jgi:hypothetical protein
MEESHYNAHVCIPDRVCRLVLCWLKRAISYNNRTRCTSDTNAVFLYLNTTLFQTQKFTQNEQQIQASHSIALFAVAVVAAAVDVVL